MAEKKEQKMKNRIKHVLPASVVRTASISIMLFSLIGALGLSKAYAVTKDNNSIYDKTDKIYFGATLPTTYYRGQIDDYETEGFSATTTTAEIYELYERLIEKYKYEIQKIDLGVCSDGEQHIYEYDLIPLTYQFTDERVKIISPTVLIISGQHGYEKSVFNGLVFFYPRSTGEQQ